MPLEHNNGNDDAKLGVTRWLKSRLFGTEKEGNTVDPQVLKDLYDVETVGRYEIIEKLGQGSMGVVYRGRDPYINRDVGIKISRPSSSMTGRQTDKYRERFFLEAQSAGMLAHPNIVTIYDAGMYRDFCYIAMEYIDGPNLGGFCSRDHLLPIGNVAEIMISACKALDYAHQRGVVHRDIKPSNIMLNRGGEVRITDFGIAQIKSDQTLSKGIIGSPSYMSPEQVKEEPITNLSDVFSLGCVMYELLTGEQAFPGDNYFSIMYKIINDNPVSMREIRPEIPEILEKIVRKALAKDTDKRYLTCMDLAYDLRVALRGLKNEAIKEDKAEDVIDYTRSVEFFSSFTREQVKEILDAASVLKAPKETSVVTEGEIDDSFYIILSGKAAVKKNGKEIAALERGECFGEMAYLSGEARTASVVTDTDCILLKISSMLLDKAPGEVQLLFLKRFAITLLRRLSSSTGRSEKDPS
jgi:eukaryotic-like serine/threonine-protein kinase